MSASQNVYEIVRKAGSAGIKCATIASRLEMAVDSVSGILSRFKQQNEISNTNGRWYYVKDIKKIQSIKKKMLDIDAFYDDMKHTWYQGYISALADYKIITEKQFSELTDWNCIS